MALIKCSKCGKEISDKAKKCVQCGYVFEQPQMRFCGECGNEIAEGATECANCGCPVEDERANNNNVIVSNNKSKKWLLGGGIVVFGICIVVLIIFLFYILNYNPVDKYNNLINTGKAVEATKLYEEKIAEDEELLSELTDLQDTEMDNIYSSFEKEDISYDEAIESINKYIHYDASKEYGEKIKDKIQKLNISRKAFSDGEKAEKEENYELALKRYKAVIKDDPLYDEAQIKLDELTETWKSKLLVEAENFSSNKQYNEAAKCIDDAISAFGSSDELLALKEEYVNLKSEQYAKIAVIGKSVTPKDTSNWIFSNYVNFVFDITNNCDKAISGIEGILTVSDLFGKEIKKMGCDFTGHTINPQETYTESDLSYECNQFVDEDMKLYNTDYADLKFSYDITSIVFEDGTMITPE